MKTIFLFLMLNFGFLIPATAKEIEAGIACKNENPKADLAEINYKNYDRDLVRVRSNEDIAYRYFARVNGWHYEEIASKKNDVSNLQAARNVDSTLDIGLAVGSTTFIWNRKGKSSKFQCDSK